MARIKISLPANIAAAFPIPIRITDINYGNHVGNNSIVEIIHEARVQFLNKYNFTELNIAGAGIIMSELLVEFKNECFYNDVLTCQIFIGEVSRKSFELFYSLIVERNGQRITIANAKTTMVCYNYEAKKAVSIPPELQKILL